VSVKLNLTARVKTPRVPNFLLGDGKSTAVGDFTDESLRAIGKLWTEALLERAREQRAIKAEDNS